MGEDDTQRPRKRRAAQACKSCRTRKVRCDLIATGFPPGCTNCKLDGVTCELMGNKRRKTIHAPQDYDGSHDIHHLEHSPVENGTKDDGNAQSLSSASLVVHEMPAAMNGDHNGGGRHDVGLGVDAAFALYSLAQPALSLPRYIDRLPSTLSAEDVAFLSAKGAFSLPPRHILQVILCRYMEFVDPALPLLDIHATIAAINDETGRTGSISILLLIAMIYAALPFVESKHVRGMGMESKLEARTVYYKKVKMLYDFGIESDSLVLAQVTLLTGTPHGSVDGIQDVWYWIGLSLSHAHSIGLHLDVGGVEDRSSKRRLRRRVWWCLFIRENVVAMGLGRPSRITYYNVPMLSLTDFDSKILSYDIGIIPSQCPVARDLVAQQNLAIILIEKAKLSVCVGRAVCVMCTIRDQTSKQSTSALPKANMDAVACARALEDWAGMLPMEAAYDPKPLSSYKLSERSLIAARAMLLMVYYDAICLLNRPLALRATSRGSADLSVSADEARRLIRWAASELVKINGNLFELDLLSYLDATGVANVVAAVVVNLLDIKAENERIRTTAIEALQQCQKFLRVMRMSYGSAIAAYRFLEATLKSDEFPSTQDDPTRGSQEKGTKVHPAEQLSSLFSPEETANGMTAASVDMNGSMQSPAQQLPSSVLGTHIWADDFGMEDWLRGDDQWVLPNFGTMDLPTTFNF